jgi:hypothetical protein
MLYVLGFLTTLTVIATGLYVMAAGTWNQLGLKFAGVALSTSAGAWLLFSQLFFGNKMDCSLSASMCLTFGVYHVVRNLALIAFHVAVGRDASAIKRGERRRGKTAWPTSISRQSHP